MKYNWKYILYLEESIRNNTNKQLLFPAEFLIFRYPVSWNPLVRIINEMEITN